MSCASRKEHVYIANTLSWIRKQHILRYLKAKNSLNRENSLFGHHFSTQDILYCSKTWLIKDLEYVHVTNSVKLTRNK